MENQKILVDENGAWMTQSANDTLTKIMKKISKDYWMRMLNDEKNVFEKRYDNKRSLKLAWIRVGRTRIMCFVDTKTMKAYKMDERREPTWMQIKHFTSERWCTGFDM